MAKRALIYKQCGFDGVTFHACYRGSTAGQLWSPLCNHRRDKYGCDSVENRARFIIELGKRCKALCGKDFIVEVQLTAVEKNSYGVEDTIEFCRLAEGAVDILQVRADNGDDAHPTGYNSVPGHHLMLDIAETIRQSGTKILIAPVGGFQNLDENESYIADGKCDMIGMAGPLSATRSTAERPTRAGVRTWCPVSGATAVTWPRTGMRTGRRPAL